MAWCGWLGRWGVCFLHYGSSCPLARTMDGHIMHWLMPISCHFRDCKALLVTSLSHVSGTITSVDLYLFLDRARTWTWLSKTQTRMLWFSFRSHWGQGEAQQHSWQALCLSVFGKPNISPYLVFKNLNRSNIWHPFRRLSNRNCLQCAVQIKSDKNNFACIQSAHKECFQTLLKQSLVCTVHST